MNFELKVRKEFIKRGAVFMAGLGEKNIIGSEQRGERPVVIIQNESGNKYSPTVQVALITTAITKRKLPTHVELKKGEGVDEDSVILAEQIRTIDKRRLFKYKGNLSMGKIQQLDTAIEVSLHVGSSKRIPDFIYTVNRVINQIKDMERTKNLLTERNLMNNAILDSLNKSIYRDIEYLKKICLDNGEDYLNFYNPNKKIK